MPEINRMNGLDEDRLRGIKSEVPDYRGERDDDDTGGIRQLKRARLGKEAAGPRKHTIIKQASYKKKAKVLKEVPSSSSPLSSIPRYVRCDGWGWMMRIPLLLVVEARLESIAGSSRWMNERFLFLGILLTISFQVINPGSGSGGGLGVG